MAVLSKPVDKVGPPLRPAAWLCPDNGDTGRKTKTSLRAMAHMHMESCMLRELSCVMWREKVRPFDPPPSLNAICRGGSPLLSPPAPGRTPRWRGLAVAPHRSLGRCFVLLFIPLIFLVMSRREGTGSQNHKNRKMSLPEKKIK